MGELSKMAIGVMFAAFVVGLLASAFYMESSDATKSEFVSYSMQYNQSDIDNANLSYSNTNDSISNFQLIAGNMQNKIAQSQKAIAEGGILEAFGLFTSLGMDTINLLLAVMFEGVNFVAGIAVNIGELPAPWNFFGVITSFAVALMVIWIVFKVIAPIVKWDL